MGLHKKPLIIMKAILGLKSNMTQVFDENGVVHPATVLKTGGATVILVKTTEKDGYNAVQVGFGERKEKNITKAEQGHYKGLGNFRYVKEFRYDVLPEGIKSGDKIEVSAFAKGDVVRVSSISKGKGFQGVVKRHGFAGGPRTHGQKHSEREPGSIGGGLRTRVPVGMRMAGRMGGDRVTLTSVKVLGIDAAKGELYVKGAVPGRRGTLVEIQGNN
jgi:large subunit ribosomal protein L3